MIRFLSSVRSRWWLLGGAWVLISLLALWGLSAVAGEVDGAPRPIIDRVYKLPDFFGRSIDFELAHSDWRINTARLLAPVVAGLTFFQGLATIFSERIARVTARLQRGHVVVCGLGEKGSRLAADYRARGDKVVAIERDATVTGIGTAQRAGVTVLVGDAGDREQLLAAGVAHASELIAVCGSDATNATIADQLPSLLGRRKLPLRCTVHLRDNRLAGQLRLQSMREDIAALRVEYFSIYRGGAAVWVGQHMPLTSDHSDVGPHVVVLGLGQLGRSLVVRSAQVWAETDTERHRPLRCTLVDRAASGRLGTLALEHPAILGRISLETIDLDLSEPSADALARFRAVLEEGPDAVFVAFDDDELSLSSALLARHAAPDTTTVVARTAGTGGLGVLLSGEGLGGEMGIVTFPLFDRTCRAEVIELGVNELLARAMHENYLQQIAEGTRQRGRSGVSWDELPADVKESNRLAAESVFGALQAVGFELIPLRRWVDDTCGLEPEHIERIAEIEHERWRAERMAGGWIAGPGRGDVFKGNVLLLPWADLPDEAKSSARETARDLPHLLARAGFEIVQR